MSSSKTSPANATSDAGAVLVELKPKYTPTNLFGERVKNYKWTAGRNAVPDGLSEAAGVSLETWRETCQAVED